MGGGTTRTGRANTVSVAGAYCRISAMRAAGVDRDLRKRAAGHSDDEVHDKYTHFWDDALRDAASQAEGFTMGGGTT